MITPDGDTEFFEILAGVLQGDTLAPFLFIIALNYALKEATRETHTGFTLTPRQSSCHVATYITDTDFADDLALISDYLEEAQLLLLRHGFFFCIFLDIYKTHNERNRNFLQNI